MKKLWMCLVLLLAGWAMPAVAQHAGHAAPTATAAPDPVARCTAFEGDKFAGGYDYARTPDATTYIHSAKIVPAANGLPSFCEVKGYISPQIGFALRLPTAGWNGKFLLTGCGEGYCGSIDIEQPAASDALKRGYAVTTSDLGHRATRTDAKWAYNTLQYKLDYAYRATHANAVVAKLIAKDFYGKQVAKSYFQGCSTGGRQGLISAQRYPDDFDGVIAGAPAMNTTTSNFSRLWSAMSNLDKNGRPILKKADLAVLHKAAVDTCGPLDKPGARQCKFDPAKAQCKGGAAAGCLSAAQVEAARKIYRGPVDSKGRAIHVAGLPPGSEPGWEGGIVGPDDTPGTDVQAMTDWFRYMHDVVDAGPLWTLRDLNWDTMPNSAGGMGAVYNADNPDLHEFAERGGKLIQYHGWQDPTALPQESTEYYELAVRTAGGLSAAQKFYRLFMIPGMRHCSGADAIDYLTSLEAWVEQGRAPDGLESGRTENGAGDKRTYAPYPELASGAAKSGGGFDPQPN